MATFCYFRRKQLKVDIGRRKSGVQPTRCRKYPPTPQTPDFQPQSLTPTTPQLLPIKHLSTSSGHDYVKEFSPSVPVRLKPGSDTSSPLPQPFSPPGGDSFYDRHMTSPSTENLNPLRATSSAKPSWQGDSSVDVDMANDNCHRNTVDSYNNGVVSMGVDFTTRDSLSDLLSDDDDLPNITCPSARTPPSNNSGTFSFSIFKRIYILCIQLYSCMYILCILNEYILILLCVSVFECACVRACVVCVCDAAGQNQLFQVK